MSSESDIESEVGESSMDSLWASLEADTRLPPQSWYIIAATTLAILNLMDDIPRVFRHAVDILRSKNGTNDQAAELSIARRMREALIKTSAIGGVPKTINALLALKTETQDHLLDKPSAPSPSARLHDMLEVPAAEIFQRGQASFDQTYGKVACRVMEQMDSSGTGDLGAIARLAYGHIISNTRILSPVETSYVLIVGLIPQDLNPQLKGHLRGALNHGATIEEVHSIRDAAIKICKAAGMKMLDAGVNGGYGWKSDVANI